MAKFNMPRPEAIEQAQQRKQEELKRARESYQKRRKSITVGEAKQAWEVLNGPRLEAVGLMAKLDDQDGDQERPHLRLSNCFNSEEYNISTETDRPTYDFAALAVQYAERLEVNQELSKLRARAAACGIELKQADCEETTDKFCRSRYKRTHAGLQRFLFDLNAEEIWQQLIQRFGADLRELNWYVLRKEHCFVFYTGKNATELNYHEDSFVTIDGAIKLAKQEQQRKQPDQA